MTDQATTILQALNNIHMAMIMCCSGGAPDDEPSTNVPDSIYKCKAANVLYGEIGTFFGELPAVESQLSNLASRLWIFQVIRNFMLTVSITITAPSLFLVVSKVFEWWWNHTSQPDFNSFTAFKTEWEQPESYTDAIQALFCAETPTAAKASVEVVVAQILGTMTMNSSTRGLIQDLVTALMTYSWINRLFDVDPAIDALPEFTGSNCECT